MSDGMNRKKLYSNEMYEGKLSFYIEAYMIRFEEDASSR